VQATRCEETLHVLRLHPVDLHVGAVGFGEASGRVSEAVDEAAEEADDPFGLAAGGGDEPSDGSQDGFTLKSHAAFGEFSLRSFLELCLSENARRLGPYDVRLLRPILVPSLVRTVVRVLPRGAPRPAHREEKAA